MTFDRYHSYLVQRLTPARMQHSFGVMHVMAELAPIYGLDPTAAQVAGLVHDIAKELSQAELIEIALAMQIPLDGPIDREPLYLHGPCGAYLAQHEMGINDPLVLEAISRHSYLGVGPAGSPVFCWCLRFADMLEPGRDWQDARERLLPLVYAGRLGEAAYELINWLVPFLESVDVIPHPSQLALQRELAQLHAFGFSGMPHDQIPV